MFSDNIQTINLTLGLIPLNLCHQNGICVGKTIEVAWICRNFAPWPDVVPGIENGPRPGLRPLRDFFNSAWAWIAHESRSLAFDCKVQKTLAWLLMTYYRRFCSYLS
jgi:hypothetical protein